MRSDRLGPALVVAVFTAVAVLVPGPARADHLPGTGGHWSNAHPQRTGKAQVYIHDYTGANWPVHNAVTKWDDQTYILVYYKSAGTCNTSWLHCVRVTEYGAWDRLYGETSYVVDSSKHLVHGQINIRLNNFNMPAEAYKRRKITCHEVGHALGLMESSSDVSCMDNDPDSWSEIVSWHDREEVLRPLYHGHSDW